MIQRVLDALNFGFSHTLKSSHFASVTVKLVMKKAKYRPKLFRVNHTVIAISPISALLFYHSDAGFSLALGYV